MPNQYSNDTKLQWLIHAVQSHNSNECLLWPFGQLSNRRTYGRLAFHGRKELAHRTAFFIAHNRWPIPCARHSCDIPACINVRHIIEGTQQQNIADRNLRNRQARGERMGGVKLTEEIVRRIRAEYIPHSAEHNTVTLAKKYGVGLSTMWYIVSRVTWKHLSP